MKNKKAKHTPGPWKLWIKSLTIVTGGMTADWQAEPSNGWSKLELEEIQANAHLISSAPELLSALCEAIKVAEQNGNSAPSSWYEAVRKAEGK